MVFSSVCVCVCVCVCVFGDRNMLCLPKFSVAVCGHGSVLDCFNHHMLYMYYLPLK